MISNQIQETLFREYYSNDEFSKVTSSHWRDFGKKTNITRSNNGFEIRAYGISAYGKRSTLRYIKHLPIDFMLSGMLSKHGGKEHSIHAAKAITKHLNIQLDFDHVKHVLKYDLLDSYSLFNSEEIICIIGDGHGFFGSLIKTLRPDARILFVNLGRNLLIDAICFSKAFPHIEPLHLQRSEDCNLLQNHEIAFLEAEQFELMQKLPISLFINVVSMQEMDVPVISRYFEYMRTSTAQPHFYCCNREEKKLSDGSVIRFADYPWEAGGGVDILLDELCPWYQKYPNSYPPFWRPFEPIRHRLVKFNY